jgi:hypothetical protein
VEYSEEIYVCHWNHRQDHQGAWCLLAYYASVDLQHHMLQLGPKCHCGDLEH